MLLCKVKVYLCPKYFKKVVHVFITCCFDYCSSLYFETDQLLLRKLQNAAAHFQTENKWHNHITPVMASLLSLPVQFRIQFKI